MKSAQQPNTSNGTKTGNVMMPEARVPTPVSHIKRPNSTQPEASDVTLNLKRKRRAKNTDSKDSVNSLLLSAINKIHYF